MAVPPPHGSLLSEGRVYRLAASRGGVTKVGLVKLAGLPSEGADGPSLLVLRIK